MIAKKDDLDIVHTYSVAYLPLLLFRKFQNDCKSFRKFVVTRKIKQATYKNGSLSDKI